ncbi:CGNR zinc finger domain-containing protein [Paenibacillus glycinis]|uniref:Zinc finger CGNR domain-containing protein n=1 Tax=Paenibacillus glycinis TaxID=2697035 RepID=A0ABW9XI78_9BACL|nr:CGNR zinc finger domain-containing protein [Paenibacillus glycinis]NBD22315.1 hypothetical protein [Paenibacillus glycinis]
MESSDFLFIGNQFTADFVNTRKTIKGERTELLTSWEELTRWLEQAGKAHVVTGSGDALPEEERADLLRRIIAFRGKLEQAFAAIEDERTLPAPFVASLNDELSGYRSYCQLDATESGVAAVRHYDVSQLPALFLEEAALFFASFKPDNLKKCENETCILHFYDTSRNQQRRWCSMDRCGNRMKANQHYHRRKSGS